MEEIADLSLDEQLDVVAKVAVLKGIYVTDYSTISLANDTIDVNKEMR